MSFLSGVASVVVVGGDDGLSVCCGPEETPTALEKDIEKSDLILFEDADADV